MKPGKYDDFFTDGNAIKSFNERFLNLQPGIGRSFRSLFRSLVSALERRMHDSNRPQDIARLVHHLPLGLHADLMAGPIALNSALSWLIQRQRRLCSSYLTGSRLKELKKASKASTGVQLSYSRLQPTNEKTCFMPKTPFDKLRRAGLSAKDLRTDRNIWKNDELVNETQWFKQKEFYPPKCKLKNVPSSGQ
jgi:hypothetical protein